ncbi:hypothetical protein ABPG75_002583 [Micractinium tetrahymenae]
MGDAPLRLVIVGHNPSQVAWDKGHFYANPSNWMWRILRDTGLAPATQIRGAEDDGKMPAVAGVGFTDVGSGAPGTDSSQFSSAHFAAWRPTFFARMAAQAARASASIPGCTCSTCGAPLVVAFSGKRQFVELFPQAAGGTRVRGGQKAAVVAAVRPAAEAPAAAAAAGGREERVEAAGAADGSGGSGRGSSGEEPARVPTLQARRPTNVATGRQWVLPEGWPLPLSTEVWVMTSTSGAAPMTREARYAPWQALAQRLRQEPWPRRCIARCSSSSGGCMGPAQGGGDAGTGRSGSA